MLDSDPVAVEPRLQPRRGIDEKDRVLDQMFLVGFVEDHLGQRLYTCRIEPHEEEAVRCGIAAAYGQYHSPPSWITVSSTAT